MKYFKLITIIILAHLCIGCEEKEVVANELQTVEEQMQGVWRIPIDGRKSEMNYYYRVYVDGRGYLVHEDMNQTADEYRYEVNEVNGEVSFYYDGEFTYRLRLVFEDGRMTYRMKGRQLEFERVQVDLDEFEKKIVELEMKL